MDPYIAPMDIKFYQVDAFASAVFRGNLAGVCPLESWLPDKVMQQIAEENNLSEIAFFVESDGCYELPWITPTVEVNLCGHATLATAWVLVNELHESANPIRFLTRSGELRVTHREDELTLDFPVQLPKPVNPPTALLTALGVASAEVFEAEDYLVVLRSERDVAALTPDFSLLKGLPLRGVIVTAPEDSVDFVSRWFGPNVGVNEDPVTGSAHTTLTPFWAERLSKNRLSARQISLRGGELTCVLDGDRVQISGKAVKYLDGVITI